MKKVVQKAGYILILLLSFGLTMVPQVGLVIQLRLENRVFQYLGCLLMSRAVIKCRFMAV